MLYIESYTNTCDICIYYIGEIIKCESCSRRCTRTNRNRHYRSYTCRVSVFIGFDLLFLFKLFLIVIPTMDVRKIDALRLLQSLDDKSVDLVLTDPPYYTLLNIEWDKQWKTK